MSKFLAYFDYLGFKQFIENNTEEVIARGVEFTERDHQFAMADNRRVVDEVRGGYVADIAASKVNCITFSDTILFWTDTDTIEDFENIVKVSYNFNWREIFYLMPVRGCVVHGHFEAIPIDYTNHNVVYRGNSVYGKALVNAYIKAESQNWAGAFVDDSAITHAKTIASNALVTTILDQYTLPYNIPCKQGLVNARCFKLVAQSLNGNLEARESRIRNLRESFAGYNKEIDASTEIKIQNTIIFLDAH